MNLNMKNRSFASLLTFISILSLSGCFYSTGSSKRVYTKSLTSYDLDKVENISTYDDIKINTDKYYFIEDEDFIPYLSLEQYSTIFLDLCPKETKITYSDSQTDAYMSVSVNSTTHFILDISIETLTVSLSGSFPIVNKTDYTQTTLTYGLNANQKTIFHRGDNTEKYDLSNLGFSYVRSSSKLYFPLGLIDAIFAPMTSKSIFYNLEGLYRYDKPSQLEKKVLGVSPMEKGKKVIGNSPMMPLYYRIYNRACFYFIMDNLYGLASVRGIKSMKNYYKNSVIDDLLISDKANVRGQAYHDALAMLSDGHTGINSPSILWNENYTSQLDKLWQDRVKLKNELKAARNEAVYEYRYNNASEEEKEFITDEDEENLYEVMFSSDKKSALFSFDQFSFFLFLRQFEEIKKVNTVENVIIDISTNGGGTIGVLYKLLGLISNDNNAKAYIMYESINRAVRVDIKVKSNGDLNFDLDDVYGDDYNIYLLTSPYSFSCANAFPYYAQKQNYVKVIGAKSGGGECSVASTYLPNGMTFQHSSMMHLGWADEEKATFEGDEIGASADIVVPYADYFNMDKLVTYLN